MAGFQPAGKLWTIPPKNLNNSKLRPFESARRMALGANFLQRLDADFGEDRGGVHLCSDSVARLSKVLENE